MISKIIPSFAIIYIFIDASNLWESQKAKGRFFDYAKLVKYVQKKFNGRDLKVFYYSAYPAEGTRTYSLDGKHKFFTFLKKGLGFTVRKKELKRISTITESGEFIEEKGNMDVEIVLDALNALNKYTTAIFFTGAITLTPISDLPRLLTANQSNCQGWYLTV